MGTALSGLKRPAVSRGQFMLNTSEIAVRARIVDSTRRILRVLFLKDVAGQTLFDAWIVLNVKSAVGCSMKRILVCGFLPLI